MATILVPIQRDGEEVGIEVNLAQEVDPTRLIRMLAEEKVPLDVWLEIAVSFGDF